MHTMTRIKQGRDNYFSHQQGVALIMVLGLLSVMVLMAVSFAIAMRTERMAAGNYLDSVKANQLVRSALHLAMADIHQKLHIVERESCSVVGSSLLVSNAYLYTDGLQIALHNVNWTNYPIYSSGLLSPAIIGVKDSLGNPIDMSGYSPDNIGDIIKRENPTGYTYPPWAAITSYSTNKMQRCQISLTNDALKYIPACLLSAVTNVDFIAGSNYWINIETTVNGKTTTVGRVAYLIANCSGLLDANYVGGSPRASGINPSEIAIEYLDEIAGDTTGFTNYRTTKGPFEILPKLAEWKASWHPSNMFCYSGFLENEWVRDLLDVDAGGLVDISGDAGKLRDKEKREDIIAAFFKCGLTNAGEAEKAYTNLVDYVDDDSYAGNEGLGFPKDLHTSVEAVPMINEVMFHNTVTIDTNKYTLTSTLTVELWYPFSFNNTIPFKFELEANIALDPAYKSIALTPISISSSNITCTSPSFQILTQTSSNSVFWDPLLDPSPPSIVKWTETITKATTTYGDQIVDQFDLPPDLVCAITTTNSGFIPNSVSVQMSKECIDPRFNWEPDNTNQWGLWTNASSIGAENLITEEYWLNNSVVDKVIDVANQPLHDLDELKHLIYSTHPWETIDPPVKHKIHEYFRLESYPIQRGYVNPNTHIRDVLAATFYKASTGGTNLINDLQAEKIAQAIIDGKPTSGYRTIQEVTEVIHTNSVITNMLTDAEIHTLTVNTVQLLNLRQNLFVIIIEAHVASGGNIPSNPAKQRAVAIVWRDPFRDNYYVRSLIFF